MKGKKTYIVAAVMLVHAVAAYFLGETPELNVTQILEAFGLATLRAGVAKAEEANQ